MTDDASDRPVAADDADRWRSAARLRREHPGWVVIWLSSVGSFRAYPLSARRRSPLTAADPDQLAAQMDEMEKAAAAYASRSDGETQ